MNDGAGGQTTRHFTCVSHSVEETRHWGEEIGRQLCPGDLVALYGPLGAGKTTLVQGIARGMRARGPVRSPSFTLVNEYETEAGMLYHLDLFRLASEEEVEEAGLGERLPGDGVAVVEWAERAASLLPPDRLDLTLEMAEGENERRLVFSPQGSRFVTLLADLGVVGC
ncbi:MAG TPA: tRNA (adenosine(37)-N6)-threonylcarbamoyltransferase complex ATPase subunit type 1 TsaE [Firmicutes bacterium]|nr:tRNA (adenosine(37)-N6)-threonylcarbamoyltransferase complex ATPase subunit type 1 TsaE [Bacillota bacterium]